MLLFSYNLKYFKYSILKFEMTFGVKIDDMIGIMVQGTGSSYVIAAIADALKNFWGLCGGPAEQNVK